MDMLDAQQISFPLAINVKVYTFESVLVSWPLTVHVKAKNMEPIWKYQMCVRESLIYKQKYLFIHCELCGSCGSFEYHIYPL